MHTVKAALILNVIVDKEGLRDWGRVGEASGLNDDAVELGLAWQDDLIL